jgi:hypothetical protein
MHYWHFIVTGTLILALVMTSGCAGLLMGDLKAEIHDSSTITVPLPLSSVLSFLVRQNTTTLPVTQSPTGEKGDPALGTTLPGTSAFHVKSGTADPTGIDTEGKQSATVLSPKDIESLTTPGAAPGTSITPLSATASCSPVAGAKVEVTLLGILNKTHIADCTTFENGNFSFDVPPSMEKPATTMYTFNFEITAPGYNLPAGSSNVVTDLANVSDGPYYTFNVCYQQPSEPNAISVTRGGIAVTGRIRS